MGDKSENIVDGIPCSVVSLSEWNILVQWLIS